MKTKQIVFTEAYTAELLEVNCPPPQADEVTVELAFSAISAGTEKANFIGQRNGTDVGEEDEPVFPRTVGYSAAGRITATGDQVSDLAVGDRVVVFWGKHQKTITVNRSRVCKIPEGVSLEEAALAFIGTFPLGAIRKTKPELGESALVMGLGILGILAVGLLRNTGVTPLLAADPLPERRELALKMGADYALDPTDESFVSTVKKLTGKGVNLCIEVTGLGIGLVQALDCMKKMGRVALLGCTRSSHFEIDYYGKVHGPGISLIGAHTMARPKKESAPALWTDADDLDTVLRLAAGKRLDLKALIGRIHSPAEAQEVYTALVRDKHFPVGVLFDWAKV